MKRFAPILVAFFLLFTACSKGDNPAPSSRDGKTAPSPQATKGSFRSVSPAEAMQLIQGRQGLVVIDVRTPQELREGAIAGSTLVPFWTVMQDKLTISRKTPVLLVCAVGGRSYAAARMLSRYGFTEVYNLSGGIAAWKKAGLPLKY